MKQIVADWINIIFGYRKFLVMMALFLIGVIFRLKGLIDGSQMVDLMKATSISFFGANGVEYVVSAIKSYAPGNKGPQDSPEPNGNVVPEFEVDEPDQKESK